MRPQCSRRPSPALLCGRSKNTGREGTWVRRYRSTQHPGRRPGHGPWPWPPPFLVARFVCQSGIGLSGRWKAKAPPRYRAFGYGWLLNTNPKARRVRLYRSRVASSAPPSEAAPASGLGAGDAVAREGLHRRWRPDGPRPRTSRGREGWRRRWAARRRPHDSAGQLANDLTSGVAGIDACLAVADSFTDPCCLVIEQRR